MKASRDAYIKILGLIVCSGYAAYGFATGNAASGAVMALFAVLILWALLRPGPPDDSDRTWIAPWLTITVLFFVMWAIAIYSTVALARGSDEGEYIFTAILGYATALWVSRIAIPSWTWLWRHWRHGEP